jgi:hypothetical protein
MEVAMSEPTLQQKIAANRRAKVPPGAKCFRSVQWRDAEGRELMALVSRGMPVADNLKAFYWAERETFSGLIAAVEKVGATLGEFAVVDDDNRVVAVSCVAPGDDADDIAWLSCMFMEMMHGRLGFITPEEIDRSNIKNGVQMQMRVTPKGEGGVEP